ncbi:MAG TPA: alanine--glyoxylate aminotransferase family protein [Candidatus Binataceae bacterium]|nr:alanine--glyoxylate aminotransferase family protein [Candidatus Binataceae bacterium]
MPAQKKYLFTPGPAPVPPEVLLAMARPMIHHRTPEFSKVLDSVREGLKPLFGTRQEVILLSSSGTGAMEAAVTNLIAPGEHAVFVNGGKFGERWGKLLAAHGVVAHEIKVEWGRAVRPEQIDDALKAHPGARAVFMQASETSTCAVHPVAEAGVVTRRHGAMLIVDGITSVGVFEQKMDEWGIDALVTGSQKALMLPPGLGIIALSPAALERAQKLRAPCFYFDLLRELKAQRDEHTTAFTPPVALIFGLHQSLSLIQGETLHHVYARHRLMAAATRAAAPALHLRLIAPDNPAPGVTGILTPDGLDGSALVRLMRDELGISVQGGQDQMKGKLVRIGHMGYLAPFDMLVAVSALEIGLVRLGHRFEPGAGVAAAQAVIAQGI